MDQKAKVLAAKSDDFSLVPEAHMVEDDSGLLQVVLGPSFTHLSIFSCTNAYAYTNKAHRDTSKINRIKLTLGNFEQAYVWPPLYQ